MFPITSNNLIKTDDFYNHFIIECVPIKQTGSKGGTIAMAYPDKIVCNLPITIQGSKQEIWRIDAFIYGLYWDHTGEHTDPIRLSLNRTNKTNDVDFLSSSLATSSGSPSALNINTDFRHSCAILDFSTQKGFYYHISGQIEDHIWRSNVSTGSISSSLGRYDYTNVTLSALGSQFRIRGLYVEFTKLASFTNV